jgi:tRNA/rRNA methyltransferase
MNDTRLLSRVRVVLSRSTHPGNIGAAARAMKTMGLMRLVLVAPRSFPHPEAVARSSGATDVLDASVICDTLPEALRGATLIAGFSARRRELMAPMRWLRDAAGDLADHVRQGGEAALLFGTESSGLANDELALCQLPVVIPTASDYASLNVASAVQLACYELRMALADLGTVPAGIEVEPAAFEEIEGLFVHLEQAMRASGFYDPVASKRLLPRLRRLFARTRLEHEEVNILRGMLNSFMSKID